VPVPLRPPNSSEGKWIAPLTEDCFGGDAQRTEVGVPAWTVQPNNAAQLPDGRVCGGSQPLAASKRGMNVSAMDWRTPAAVV
jgi:hypothetical protein